MTLLYSNESHGSLIYKISRTSPCIWNASSSH